MGIGEIFGDVFDFFAGDPPSDPYAHDRLCQCIGAQGGAPALLSAPDAIEAIKNYVEWRKHFGVLAELP